MWNGKKVSVVLMTYAERDSIRSVIEGFFATGLVDEVLVVDNNAQPGTARGGGQDAGARWSTSRRQGYGHATRRGLLEAQRRPDRAGRARRHLPARGPHQAARLQRECDAVFGTRTTRELIWAGANMAWFLRWGNWAVAKLVEVLFNTSHLSDVGCTYRLLRRETARAHGGRAMTVGGSHAGAEVHAADDRLRRALRRGAGQLPAARRQVVGDRQAAARRCGSDCG